MHPSSICEKVYVSSSSKFYADKTLWPNLKASLLLSHGWRIYLPTKSFSMMNGRKKMLCSVISKRTECRSFYRHDGWSEFSKTFYAPITHLKIVQEQKYFPRVFLQCSPGKINLINIPSVQRMYSEFIHYLIIDY